MTKIKAIESMLFGSDQYTTITLIRRYGSYRKDVSEEIFNRCKEIDRKKIDIDIRPNHVLKSTFFSVVGIDFEHEVLRYHSFLKVND